MSDDDDFFLLRWLLWCSCQNVKRDVFGLCLSSAGDLTHSNVTVSLFLRYLTQMLLLQALLQDARNFNGGLVGCGVVCCC